MIPFVGKGRLSGRPCLADHRAGYVVPVTVAAF